MHAGQEQLSIAVIPTSGTGDLTGLSGSMKIERGEGGAHSYVFEYML